MMLSRADLEAIRQIVRQEIGALAAGYATELRDATPRDNDDDTTAELARARLAALRGEPGARERLNQLDARRLLTSQDKTWCARARKLRGIPKDEPLTEADLLAALQHYRRRK